MSVSDFCTPDQLGLFNNLVETAGLVGAPLHWEQAAEPFRGLLPEDVRVIILGQDPYPDPTKANGLAFGIRPEWEGARLRSSFGNIAGEITRCAGGLPVLLREWASLRSWREQGVLLLNTRLSVAPGKPGSHRRLGWEPWVGGIIHSCVQARKSKVVLVALGAEAERLLRPISKLEGCALQAFSHPCKYSASRGSKRLHRFIGSDLFSNIDSCLDLYGIPCIDWLRVPDPEGTGA